MEERLKQAQIFLNFYFAPWGAAKGEVWEALTTKPFRTESAADILNRILDGRLVLCEQDIKLIKIVVPDS